MSEMSPETEPMPRILVVDDMPANVRLLEAILEPAGYAVVSASSGPEALERVVADTPDLVGSLVMCFDRCLLYPLHSGPAFETGMLGSGLPDE